MLVSVARCGVNCGSGGLETMAKHDETQHQPQSATQMTTALARYERVARAGLSPISLTRSDTNPRAAAR